MQFENVKKWKKYVGKETSLTDLSQAFDSLDQKLLTTELNTYSFNIPPLRLIHDYLSNIKERTKTENTYITCMEIVLGVIQGSIWRPLLFNTFSADLFFIISNINISSYTDDNTSYITADSIDGLIKQWFENSFVKNNNDKFDLLINK